MGLLDSILAADAAAFVDTDVFGESVSYNKKNGTNRTIKAVVVRNPPQYTDSAGRVVAPKMQITLTNSATLGILRTELDLGGDGITVAYPYGSTARKFLIVLPTDGTGQEDAGMLRLELH